MSKNILSQSTKQSDTVLYIRTLLFSLGFFAFSYWYISWQGIPNALNKSVADTAVIVMGLSMIISSLCYFFNIFDPLIAYRKHLGLIGFGFAVAHLFLSWSAFTRLFVLANWQQGSIWPIATAAIATIIFSIMSLMSVNWIAKTVGGKAWKFILRAGYAAFILVAAHVFLLKASRWQMWLQEDSVSLPSLSLISFVFIIVLILARILLWLATKNKALRA